MSEGGSKGQDGDKPSAKEKLQMEIQSRLREAEELQKKSLELHKQAEEEEDPDVAQDLKFRARQTDKDAAKLMKIAERLQAGWLQGGAMGGGMGLGIAGGIGAAVGSILTGVVAIPTSGLGMLIGAGTGLAHGPWIKYTNDFSEDEAQSIVKEAEEEAEKVSKS